MIPAAERKKLFVGYIVNNDNKRVIEETLSSIIKGLKALNPQIKELHFVDFLHNKRDFVFAKEKRLRLGDDVIKNDKDGKYGFFEFFVELTVSWIENGVIEAVFVSESESWKDSLLYSISEMQDGFCESTIKKDYKIIMALLKKCSDYIWEEYDDEELPIIFIADNFGSTNDKEIELSKECFLGSKLLLRNSSDNVLIQLADFLAFAYNRYYNEDDKKFKDIVVPLVNLIKK